MSLRPCTGCARHVRHDEPACPFCRVALPLGDARGPVVVSRAGRAAIMAFGATLASATTGCPDDTMMGGMDAAYGGPPIDAAIADDVRLGGFDALYGGPPTDADVGEDAAMSEDAPIADDVRMGGFDAAYGGPPLDAAMDDASGGPAPAYGTPSM